jgi:autoinducer 2-degrading protein
MYVIVGTHKILDQNLDSYVEGIQRHAATSRNEPGCIRYEVLRDLGDPTTFLLYEVFEDNAAYEAHAASGHHESWMAMSKDWRVDEARTRRVMNFV